MKQNFTLLVILLSTLGSIKAQDILIKSNGTEIKSKVLEIGLTEIRYKAFDNLEGPTIVLAKSDVFMIKYENGRKEVLNDPSKAVVISRAQTKKLPQGKLSMRGTKFYQNNRLISNQLLVKLLRECEDDEAYREYRKGRKAKIALPLLIAGAPVTLVGLGFYALGNNIVNEALADPYNYSGDEYLGYEFMAYGVIFGVVGVGCLTTGTILRINGMEHYKKAVKLYNESFDKQGGSSE